MRVVIAPDKLRGTYTADEAARALARGWGAHRQDDLRLVPLADGGEGTAAALLAARGGTWRAAPAHDARGRPVEARYADLGAGQAAMDVAEACGMWRVADLAPDPLAATSLGAGELIGRAIADGGTRIVVGVGGTATTDGGAGLRRALGSVPEGVSLVAALDVDNPLLGAAGAAAVYGPQKGASPQQVVELERRLAALRLASAGRPGAGAGGGIGAMLMELGAEAVPGARLVLDEVGFDPSPGRGRSLHHRRGQDRRPDAARQGGVGGGAALPQRRRGLHRRGRHRRAGCGRRARRAGRGHPAAGRPRGGRRRAGGEATARWPAVRPEPAA